MNKIPLLYVDDEDINLQLFRINFANSYEVHLAPSGQDGLNILRENPHIGLVISDMKMPTMDGLEFITAAKEKYPNTKFYILTAFKINEEIKQALQKELIQSYLEKPLDPKAIHETIASSGNN